MVLTVTLNPALDVFYRPDGQRYVYAGGKGINVSRAFQRLGGKTVAVGCIGGESGDNLRKFLYREGICCEFVRGNYPTRVNITILPQRVGPSDRIFGKGHALSAEAISSVRKLIKRYGRSVSVVVLSGSLPEGSDPRSYRMMINEVQAMGVPCLLDSHGDAFRLGIQAKPVYIKPNLAEAEDFFGCHLRSVAQRKQALCRFRAMGIENVVISLGRDGAVGANACGMWMATPPTVKERHTVGCGDAFVAGFLSALEKKESFSLALQMATAAGSAAVHAQGPARIDPRIVRRIFPHVRLKPVA